jgi:gluconate 2-dehydrogenase gamma chain
MKENKRVLTLREERALAAIADRIFPATDTPGAVEAGAVDYILLALSGAYASQLSFYRNGLRAVNRRAREKFGAAFASLRDEQKDAILSEFEAGSTPGWKKAAEFFETLRYHVLEGVFCEPRYGGNKNMIGWRLVNFPGQQFGYADAYINKRVDIEPLAVDDSGTEES